MTRVLRPVAVAAIIGTLLGAGAVGLIWLFMSPGRGLSTPPPGDRVQHAIDALRTDHVYVGPEVRDRFSGADLAALRDAAEHAPVPTYVLCWEVSGSDWGPTIYAVAQTQLEAALGDDAVIVTADPTTGNVDVGGGRIYGTDLDDIPAKAAPGPALLADLQDLADDPWTTEPHDDDDPFTAAEGLHQGLIIGGGIGVGAALLTAIAAAVTYSDARASANTKKRSTNKQRSA